MLAIFASVALQFSAMKTARAEYLVYCFSEDNLECYVDLDSMKTVQDVFGDEGIKVTIHAKGYSFTIDSILTCPVIEITFFPPDWYICVFTLNGGYKQGRISQSWKAMAVYTILTNPNTIQSYEQHNREVEAQQRREEEAREREKQRLAEQKRREEEARKNKFNSIIAAGDQAYTAKDYLAAAQSYESAQKLDIFSVGKFVKELVKNGDNLNSQRNYSAALDYYKKAVVMNPDNSSNRDKLWETYVSSKNFSDGAHFYRTMTTIKPDDNNNWFRLGYSLSQLKDYDGAIAAYTRSAELKPNDFVTYNNRGDAYKNSWRYDEAIEDYKKALELKPDDETTLSNLWDVYYKSGKFDEAIDFYKSCATQKPNDTKARRNLWNAYCKFGKFDDAANFYTKRVTKNEKDSDSWFKLGWSLNKQKKFPDAIKAMQKAIKLNPSAFSYYWLARVYQNAGDTKKAVDACKKALKLDPKHTDAKKLLAQLSGGK